MAKTSAKILEENVMFATWHCLSIVYTAGEMCEIKWPNLCQKIIIYTVVSIPVYVMY